MCAFIFSQRSLSSSVLNVKEVLCINCKLYKHTASVLCFDWLCFHRSISKWGKSNLQKMRGKNHIYDLTYSIVQDDGAQDMHRVSRARFAWPQKKKEKTEENWWLSTHAG